MAFSWNVSQSPATGAEAIFNLKVLLKGLGAPWTVPKSSDGTTYNAAGDQITLATSGAGGMANANAWFVIQMPTKQSVNRQLCFQRTSGNTLWRVKYSYSAGFTGGTPGISRVPSATDEQVLLGSGTDASPTGAALFGTDGTYRLHQGVGDSSDEYQLYSVAYPVGGGNINHLLMLDCLVAGTFPAGDIEPYVLTCAQGAIASATHANVATDFNSKILFDNSLTTGPKSWLKKGAVGEAFQGVCVLAFCGKFETSTVAIQQNMPTNALTGEDEGLPCFYARGVNQTTPNGFKGASRLLRWAAVNRVTGDTLTVGSTRDRIVLDAISLPFNGTVPVI